jgi:ribonuclease M5
MIKPRCPIVVEGRYDRIRLASVIDGVVLETGGFRIFRDKELLSSLRAMAKSTGLIILTDSDDAGFRIRNFLKNALGKDAKLTQVYIPAVQGKERRKAAPSAEGLLGVEGMDEQVLLDAFHRAGVDCDSVSESAGLTRGDLYDAHLIGCDNAAERRRALLRSVQLPPRISTSVLLDLINMMMTREEFERAVRTLDEAASTQNP